MKFEEFNLDEKLIQGLTDAGYIECMPVQEQTLKETLNRRDAAVQSQTGTGKTAAFLISVLQHHQEKDKNNKKTLIVVPTRELAVQIEEEAVLLSKYMDINIVSIFGGTGYKKQEDLIAKGADIIIGTPGRLIDFGKSGKISFKEIGTLIIDEADRMFDMGFIPDLRWMIRRMPPREERSTMLFSATLNSRVRQLAWEYMNDPAEIEITPESITVEEIEQVLYHVSREEKIKLLLGILKKEKPERAVIFINTKQKAVELSKRLNLNGFKSSYLMGDMPQKKRLSIIDRVKSGDIKLLVATDVAARGLHINDLEMVFNFDLPEDCENYVHRIGRTARAGKTGKAVSLACEKFVLGLPAIEEYIKMKIPVAWPEEELFAEDESAGIHIRHERTDSGSRRTTGRDHRGSSGGRGSVRRDSRRGGRDTRGKSFRDDDTARDRRRTGKDFSAGGKTGDDRKPAGSGMPAAERKTSSDRRPAAAAGSSHVRPENIRNGNGTYKERQKKYQDNRRKAGRIEKEPVKNLERNAKKSSEQAGIRKKGRSYEERIKYYNEKYGESIPVESDKKGSGRSDETKKKKSFLQKIKKIIKK